MKKRDGSPLIIYFILLGLILLFLDISFAQSKLDCAVCHSGVKNDWTLGRHSNTQRDLATELSANWIGQSPDSVIHGSAAEDCVSCHGPVAVTTGSGLSEAQVMGHFFTTMNGSYTAGSTVADTVNWPHVSCVTCHNVPGDHPSSMPAISIFNSGTAQYDSLKTTSALCGQCHGSLKFAATDHRIYDAWKTSRHGHQTQQDIAGELAANWAGQSPDSVIYGSSSENCIACHSPTAVRLPSTGTEANALFMFFTTVDGQFTTSTIVADTAHWPDMACDACHNPHNPGKLSYFNSSTRSYQVMKTSNELCGQCHGSLRFSETDHRSYDLETGTGAIGVADKVTMPGAQCVDCHMAKSEIDGSNSRSNKGHSWSPIVMEPDGSMFASCTSCHPTMDGNTSIAQIATWKNEFAHLDSIADATLTTAETALTGSHDSTRIAQFAAAQHNLEMAELDESGGFHNHKYSIALLNDVVARSSIITGIKVPMSDVPTKFALNQNFPNPFNPLTSITFNLPNKLFVSLKIFDLIGREVATIVSEELSAGTYSKQWNANGMTSGVYFYRLQAGSYSETKKLVLLR